MGEAVTNFDVGLLVYLYVVRRAVSSIII